MPGFIIHTGLSPFELALENRKKLVVETIKGDCFFAQRRVVNKFMNDRIFLDTKEYTVIVEGVVLNNHDLIDEYASESWAGCVVTVVPSLGHCLISKLRSGLYIQAILERNKFSLPRYPEGISSVQKCVLLLKRLNRMDYLSL